MKHLSYKLLILLLLPFFLFSQEKEKRLALVIGNANYDSIAKLANPVNDAKLIARTLDSLDFEVILATDLDKGEFMSKVVEFGKKRADYDVGFVYYAGHGLQINGENYLLPTNQNFDEEWKVEEYAINVNRIMKYLTALTDQVNILVLDACRNNPWEGNFRSVGGSSNGGLAKIPAPTGSLIAFSTDAGSVAADGDGENSIYCISLVKNMLLENTTLDQVFRNVRTDVLIESKKMQRPIESSQLTGQAFYLVKSDFTKTILEIEDLLERNLLFDALELSTSLIEKNPSEISYKIRGNIYFKMNNHQKAIVDYLRCLKINPTNLDVLFFIGQSYYYSSNFKESVDYLTKCINSDCNADAYMFRALSSENINKLNDQIIADWKRYQELLPNSPYANYGLARKLTLSNDRIKYLEKAIELEIKSKTSTKVGLLKNKLLLTEASFFLGQEYIKIKKYEKAIEIVEKGIEINPEDERGHLNKFEFIIGYNNYDNRTIIYDELKLKNSDLIEKINGIPLTQLGSGNRTVATLLIHYSIKIGEYEIALKINNKAISLSPKDLIYDFDKAKILLLMKKYNQAAKVYESLIEKDSSPYQNMEGVIANLSVCYIYLADEFYDEEEYKLAIDYNKKGIELIKNLNKFIISLDDRDNDYGLAVNHHRLNNFYDALAMNYKELGDESNRIYYLNKIEEILNKGIDMFPKIYPPLYGLRANYYNEKLNNCENCDKSDLISKVIYNYKKTIELDPLYNRSYLGLHFAYLKSKDFKKAKESINKAIKTIDYTQFGFYNYKIAYLLHFKEYEECLLLVDEMNDFLENNKVKAPFGSTKTFNKYFEQYTKARLSHLKSYLYYNTGQEFESIVEISKSIKIISKIYNSDSSALYYYNQPHSYIGEKYDVNHNEYKYDNDKIFMLTYFDKEKKLYKFNESYDRNSFYNLFIIRANLFKELGLQNKAFDDYKNALKFIKKGSDAYVKIEELISKN